MKKIFLLSLCCYAFIFCDTEPFEIIQIQESFLEEILKNYPDLTTWYSQATDAQKAELDEWICRLVNLSVNVIRRSDGEFIDLLQEFEDITQLTNAKLVTAIDVTLEPTVEEDDDHVVATKTRCATL